MKIFSTLTAATIAVVTLSGCDRTASRPYRDAEGAAWATTFHVTYRSDRDLSDSILAVMRDVELSLSPFCDISTVSRINRGETSLADPMLVEVFTASMRVNSLSGGAFDPTVGPLVSLWGFGEAGHDTDPPTPTQIDSALTSVGIARCHLRGDTLLKASPDTRFNFSAITKGYGCDKIGEMLRRNGCEDFMVEIGGEIALAGVNRRGEEWRIMVDAPVADDSTVTHRRLAVISLTDKGIATSGNYRNYRQLKEGRMGHTISPVTGRPIASSTLSATAIAPTTMLADAIATACMAMDPDSAIAMADRIADVSVMLVSADGNGGWKLVKSKGFPEMKE